MPKTTITFDQGGGMKIDATGYTGKVCAETTDKLLAGLKTKKHAEEKKPEYNMMGNAAASEGIKQRW